MRQGIKGRMWPVKTGSVVGIQGLPESWEPHLKKYENQGYISLNAVPQIWRKKIESYIKNCKRFRRRNG